MIQSSIVDNLAFVKECMLQIKFKCVMIFKLTHGFDCFVCSRRQAPQCITAADCTCPDTVVVIDCHHGHCTCHHDSSHHPLETYAYLATYARS